MSFDLAFLYRWQELVGAFIGAATPVSFWFFTQWIGKMRERTNNLYYLEKTLVYRINHLIDADTTVRRFIDDKVSSLLSNIVGRTPNNQYSVDMAFFPLFAAHHDDMDLQRIATGSAYLDNKISQMMKLSKDFGYIIDDLRMQFREMVENNRTMAFGKLNPVAGQNESYRSNVNEFIHAVKRDFFEKNVPVYLRSLVTVRVATSCLRKIGILRWKMRFSPNFKFFWNKDQFNSYLLTTHERIDSYFDKEINEEVKKIRP